MSLDGFMFVDGVEAAIERQQIAGDKLVCVGGGASIAQQALRRSGRRAPEQRRACTPRIGPRLVRPARRASGAGTVPRPRLSIRNAPHLPHRQVRRTDTPDPAATARAIIDANLYMTLGTADEAGQPWVSPVYYAPDGYREFLWVSSPDSRHSRNIAGRRDVSIVIFDSSAAIDTGNGVYMSAVAREAAGDERTDGIELFSRRSLSHGGRLWVLEDVHAPATLRLYRATAIQLDVLEPHTDRRIQVRA